MKFMDGFRYEYCFFLFFCFVNVKDLIYGKLFFFLKDIDKIKFILFYIDILKYNIFNV